LDDQPPLQLTEQRLDGTHDLGTPPISIRSPISNGRSLFR